ncbi:hypothetical protein BZA77DRAFT_378719 [Pyronema omphalodes]|nr:hypothetical protein BZA77DRAFT_378719 [Pyronema omphalodes]
MNSSPSPPPTPTPTPTPTRRSTVPDVSPISHMESPAQARRRQKLAEAHQKLMVDFEKAKQRERGYNVDQGLQASEALKAMSQRLRANSAAAADKIRREKEQVAKMREAALKEQQQESGEDSMMIDEDIEGYEEDQVTASLCLQWFITEFITCTVKIITRTRLQPALQGLSDYVQSKYECFVCYKYYKAINMYKGILARWKTTHM